QRLQERRLGACARSLWSSASALARSPSSLRSRASSRIIPSPPGRESQPTPLVWWSYFIDAPPVAPWDIEPRPPGLPPRGGDLPAGNNLLDSAEHWAGLANGISPRIVLGQNLGPKF